MRTRVGLWIDHRKAIVVSVTDKGEETRLIISRVEKQPGRLEGTRSVVSYESQRVMADDSRQRKYAGHLKIYYEALIACIRDAESILIFGPGEAKGELRKRLKRNGLGERIVGIETIDRMTDHQVAAKVRLFFKESDRQ